MSTTEIALFPIPELVAFPGTVVPLHVFEPRYRTMVHDAVRDERMIGVCHTKKQIHPGKSGQSLNEALSSNQATYQPCDVFSAGRVEIVEMTEDGRIHANIYVRKRFRIKREVQTLPYRIVEAEVLEDEADQVETAEQLARVNEQLIAVVSSQNPRVVTMLRDPDWSRQTTAQFTFKVFQFLRFDPELMQTILESRKPAERL
ncbi:MAG: LON peptidase substrate-binding domain-containing protein [Gammaproteobacteria bacterium]|nr:LON peptidase substrate-binding domain-containing protein [Gammaproteobacteria bacterium]